MAEYKIILKVKFNTLTILLSGYTTWINHISGILILNILLLDNFESNLF